MTLFIALFALSVHAKTAPTTSASATEQHLMDQARQETTADGVAKSAASDAQVDSSQGILVLKDPGLTQIISPWKWLVGIRAQRFAPQGQTKMSGGQGYDLSDAGVSTMPVLDVGLSRILSNENSSTTWNGTFRAYAGYLSQETTVTFPTGVRAPSPRLTTGLLGADLVASARFAALHSFEWELGLGTGILSYTQSSSNDAANFGRQGRYNEFLVGAVYWFSDRWSATLEEEHRNLESGEEGIALQADNVSLGARVTW